MRSVFFPPGWVLALILTTFGAQANGICQWLTIQWSPDDSKGDFSLYHVVVLHSWATKCTQPGRWKSSIYPWSFSFWDDDRVWVKEHSPPWCGKNNTTSLAEWPPWVIGEIIPNWLEVCARLTFAQKWKLSSIKGNSTSGHRILWECGGCSIQTTSISHELDKHQESPGIFNNHPLHSIFLYLMCCWRNSKPMVSPSFAPALSASGQDHPLSMTLGKNAEVVLQKAQKSAASGGTRPARWRGLLRTSEDFWGEFSQMNKIQWWMEGAIGCYRYSRSLLIKWQIVASQGATENCPITWWRRQWDPLFIPGYFAGGYRNAKQISIESADSGLDSWIVPSSHHPMTQGWTRWIQTQRLLALNLWRTGWSWSKHQSQDEPIKQQSYDVYFLSTVYLRSTYISPVHLIILGDLNTCLCCSNL